MLALDRLPANDPTSRMIEQVYKAGERAVALTKQLLAFSRKEIVAPTELDLNSLIREIEKMMKWLNRDAIEIGTTLSNSLSRIKADAGQIAQVLINLAVNARDAMPSGGKLTFKTQDIIEEDTTTESCSIWVRLTVEDSGSGMSPEVQKTHF